MCIFGALFLHAMWLPWQLLHGGWIYQGRVFSPGSHGLDPFDHIVDGIWFMIVFGYLLCVSLAGALWSSCLGALQADAVDYCLTSHRSRRRYAPQLSGKSRWADL